jgi:hypothetical protein
MTEFQFQCTDMLYQKYFKYLLRKKSENYKRIDKHKGYNIPELNFIRYLFDVFIQSNCICSICMTPLTFNKNIWTDVSFDRIDNTKGHFEINNLRIVCSLHQVTGKRVLNHNLYLHMLYVQNHIELDESIKMCIKNVHNIKTCEMCLEEKL